MGKYLCVITTCDRDGADNCINHEDYYSSHDTLEEARKAWDAARENPNSYSAHVCVCVDSTDYETVRDYQWPVAK
jgi:hypothetical protein